MKIKEFEVFGFRNLKQIRLTFGPENVILLAGSNAQGKTNFLEAVHVLATTTGFRTRRDQELTSWGAEGYRVAGRLEHGVPENKGFFSERLEVISPLKERKKTARVDGAELERLSQILGHLRVAMLVPEDLTMIAGEPKVRRGALDLYLCQLSALYLSALQDFNRASRQRSRVLAESNDEAAVHAWDSFLIENGSELMIRRRRAVRALAERVKRIHERITGGRDGELRMIYRPSLNLPEDEAAWERDALRERYRRELEERTADEMRLGYSLWGPARDDVGLFLEKEGERVDLRKYGSQGQRRTAALSWRIAEAQLLGQEESEGGAEGARIDPPVVLLDDVLGELDGGRVENLLSHLEEGEFFGPDTQIIMTTTDAGPLKTLFPTAQVFNVENGTITPSL